MVFLDSRTSLKWMPRVWKKLSKILQKDVLDVEILLRSGCTLFTKNTKKMSLLWEHDLMSISE